MEYKESGFFRAARTPGPGHLGTSQDYGPVDRKVHETGGSTNVLKPADIQAYSYWHENFCICALCKATPNSNGEWRRGEPVYTYTVKERCLDVGVIEADEDKAVEALTKILSYLENCRSKPPLVVGSFYVSSLSERWAFAIEHGTHPTQQRSTLEQLVSDVFSGRRQLPVKQLIRIDVFGSGSFWVVTISNSGNWYLI